MIVASLAMPFKLILKGFCLYKYTSKYTAMAKNIGTLGKYDLRKLWKWICIVNPFDILL